jgi:sugar phosphate isomerase/epimerase
MTFSPAFTAHPAMQLSCADSAFPKLSHAAALAVIRDLGIAAVDVCVFYGYDHTPPARVVADPDRAADEVLARLERQGLAVADAFAILGGSFEQLAVNHPDEAVRAESLRQFERLLRFARRIAAPGLTILPGAVFDGVAEDDSRALAARELQPRAERAGEAGLQLSIEPHYESIAATPATTLDLLERVPQLTLALDYSHFVYQGIAEQEIDALLPRTRHLHVRQAAPGAIQTRAREGTIDFGRIRDRLLDAGYAGFFALEYQHEEGWLDFAHVDCVAETAAMRDVLLGLSAAG